jgi:hypothetical protein
MGFKGVVPATSYTFNAGAKTITFGANYSTIALSDILYVLNAKSGTATVIYDPTDAAKGGTYAGRTLTLNYDTTSMSNSDPLQIIIAEGDVGSQINDLAVTLRQYLMAIQNPPYVQSGSAQVNVTGGTLPTVTTVGTVTTCSTVTTVTGVTNLGGYPADQATLIPLAAANFSFIRERIS